VNRNAGCAARTDQKTALRRTHPTYARSMVMVLLSLLLVSAFAGEVKEDPIERQVLDIAKDLRCTVCQNQPISESNADLARDMRDIIREQIKAGKSRQEIVQYFVDRYGNFVLMNPPAEGPGTLLWILPAMIAATLAAAALFYLTQRRRRALPPPPVLSPRERERVRRAREDLDA